MHSYNLPYNLRFTSKALSGSQSSNVATNMPFEIYWYRGLVSQMQQKAQAHLWECVHSAFQTRSGWQYSLCHPGGPGLCDGHDRWEGHFLRESFFSLRPQLLSYSHVSVSRLLKWNRCDQSPHPAIPSELIPTDDLPTHLTSLWTNWFTGCTPAPFLQYKNALCFVSQNNLLLLIQDAEKMKRLHNAINAQTNYTIAVSIFLFC